MGDDPQDRDPEVDFEENDVEPPPQVEEVDETAPVDPRFRPAEKIPDFDLSALPPGTIPQVIFITRFKWATTTEKKVRELLEPFGPLKSVHMKPKSAFIEFVNMEDAHRAKHTLHCRPGLESDSLIVDFKQDNREASKGPRNDRDNFRGERRDRDRDRRDPRDPPRDPRDPPHFRDHRGPEHRHSPDRGGRRPPVYDDRRDSRDRDRGDRYSGRPPMDYDYPPRRPYDLPPPPPHHMHDDRDHRYYSRSGPPPPMPPGPNGGSRHGGYAPPPPPPGAYDYHGPPGGHHRGPPPPYHDQRHQGDHPHHFAPHRPPPPHRRDGNGGGYPHENPGFGHGPGGNDYAPPQHRNKRGYDQMDHGSEPPMSSHPRPPAQPSAYSTTVPKGSHNSNTAGPRYGGPPSGNGPPGGNSYRPPSSGPYHPSDEFPPQHHQPPPHHHQHPPNYSHNKRPKY